MSRPSPKFSPGDVFIVVAKDGTQPYENDQRGQIVEEDSFSKMLGMEHIIYKVTFDDGQTSWVWEQEIEHEQVANSPLYKALR